MKLSAISLRIITLLILFIIAGFTAEVFAFNQNAASSQSYDEDNIVEITVGDGNFIPPFRIPLDFYYRSSINQTIYFDHELDSITGLLTGITLYTTFISNLPQRQVEFYIATTPLLAVPSGFLPGSIFTKVFDGKVDFPAGENAVFIPFQQPFYYGGNNLVVMAHRVYNQYIHNQDDKFFSTTNLDYWNRSRQLPSNSVTYDPMNLPSGGTARPSAANATFRFYTGALGGLTGQVKDNLGSALPAAEIKIAGTSFVKKTSSAGAFAFPHLPVGQHTLEINLQGFLPKTINISIEQDQTLDLEIILTELALVSITGTVSASDLQGQGLQGALVSIEGYSTFQGITNLDGSFTIDSIFGFNNYEVTISHPQYFSWHSNLELDSQDQSLGSIVLTERTYHVSNLVASETPEGALLNWDPPSPQDALRYDDGVAHSRLGFNFGTFNSVLGAAHYRHAEIHQIRWYLTSNTVHNNVKLWIIGLDDQGKPDPGKIIQTYEQVPNIMHQWNSFDLPESLYLPHGFFLGVSAHGFLGLANDKGTQSPWEYVPGVQFGTFNIHDPLFPFTQVEEWGMQASFLLRAYGYDFGPAGENKATIPGRALESFRIYRLQQGQEQEQQFWDEMSAAFTSYEYVDENWHSLPPAVYRYAVVAEYTNDEFSRAVVSNVLANDMLVPFTVSISTNSGDNPLAAVVTISGGDDYYSFEYELESPEDGIVIFPEIWRGIYNISVSLQGFHTFEVIEFEILDELQTLEVILVENIQDPYGLAVETHDLEPGQAFFTWNNFYGYPNFHDGFESGDFQGWGKFIQGPGEPGNQGNAFWYATDEVDGNSPPEGDYIAKANWGYDIDTWLITPLLHIQEASQLSFFWYSSYFWSVDPNPNAQLMIKISEDDGLSWTQLWNWQHIGQWNSFSWYETTLDLDNLAGKSILVGLHLEANNNAITQIDNITIGQGRKTGTRAISNAILTEKDARRAPEGMPSAKALLGFNVFLDDMSQPIATQLQDTEFLFEQLAEGEYVAGVQAEYTTGLSTISTISFYVTEGYIPPAYQVTFNVSMHAVDINPSSDVVYITGDMLDWQIPGDMPLQQTMHPTEEELVYTATFELQAGTYQYKYFLNSGWNGAEWEGEPMREITVEDHMVVNNVFGDINDGIVGVKNPQEPLVNVFPNPANNKVNIVSSASISMIKLFSIDGRLLEAWPNKAAGNELSLDIGAFSNGIYLLQIISGNGVNIEKLQISRY
jgi:hypothetical protein